MKRLFFATLLALVSALAATAQERKVQNRPYTDLRPFHFGVVVGTHLQDIEFLNAGPQMITGEDGTTVESVVTCDQDRWDNGFNVGVSGEFRLSTYFQLRVVPTMYFGNRRLTFHDFTNLDSDGQATEQHQDLKTAYISSAVDLIFAGPRFNNHRPYLLAGINPMLNLSGKDSDYIKLKRYSLSAEVGLGWDCYLPFFKLRPELKFVYGLGNSLDTKHTTELRDKNALRYSQSVSKATTKMVVLSFFFE